MCLQRGLAFVPIIFAPVGAWESAQLQRQLWHQ
jgi:hypothetical protein